MSRLRYLRIAVTSQCNLRCVYCSPEGPPANCRQLVPAEQLGLLVKCAAQEGVCKVRLTGGEPLLRGDIEDMIQRVSSTPGIEETALTTNGIGLADRAVALRHAGLDRVNVSCDTLSAERFRRIAGYDLHSELMQGIESARNVFPVVKLNTVVMKGYNSDEIEPLVKFAAKGKLWIRFIELYSSSCIGSADGAFMSCDEVKGRLEAEFGTLLRADAADWSVEESYVLPALNGVRIGLIRSATRPPCARCAKLRFTASGELRACLFGQEGVSLTGPLAAKDGVAVRAAIRSVFRSKDRTGCGHAPSVPAPIACIGG